MQTIFRGCWEMQTFCRLRRQTALLVRSMKHREDESPELRRQPVYGTGAAPEQDEDLAEVIRELRQAKGEGKAFRPRELREKLDVLGPSIGLRELSRAISVSVVDTLGVNWDEMFGRLVAYQRAHRDCSVPVAYVTNDGARLGSWVNAQRTKRFALSEPRARKLERLQGWTWSPLEDAWQRHFAALKKFRAKKGHYHVPTDFVTDEGLSLGGWTVRQRTNRNTMPEMHRRQLEGLHGWVWSLQDSVWDEAFQQLKGYLKSVKGAGISPSFITKDGFALGKWVLVQRHLRDEMAADRRRRLERLEGWSWNPRDDAWERGFRHLRAYAMRTRHCRVPQGYTTEDGFALGSWVSGNRHRASRLPKERRDRLESLPGWSWDPFAEAWEHSFQHLMKFSKREGHCRVPVSRVEKDGCKLGKWVVVQRQAQGKMDEAHRCRLEALVGWTWNPYADDWGRMFRELAQYEARVGHARVPVGHVTSSGVKLGSWVRRQRRIRDAMTQDRRQRLESLVSWSWNRSAGKRADARLGDQRAERS